MRKAGNMQLLTTEQAARRLGLSAGLIRRYCRQGRLGKRVGRNFAISESDLRKFAAVARLIGKPPKSPRRDG